jgi:hypothetical protein
MKSEFIRFGLSKFSTTAILEIVSHRFTSWLTIQPLFLLSSWRLSLLMFLSNSQLKIKDGLLASSPALFYFGLNLYIFTYQCKVYLINDSVMLVHLAFVN